MIVAMQQTGVKRVAYFRSTNLLQVAMPGSKPDRPVLIVTVAVEGARQRGTCRSRNRQSGEILQTGCLVPTPRAPKAPIDQRKSHAPTDCGISSMERP